LILEKLISNIPVISKIGNLNVEVKGICQDSRTFKSADLFIAVKGSQFDGHDFIADAIKRGASAIFCEREFSIPRSYKGAVIRVKSCNEIINPLAQNFFSNPSEKLFVIGITGTNGKTTTTHMVEAVLNGGNLPTAIIGTIDNHFKGDVLPASHTTPDPIALQSMLSRWESQGAKAVALEVSSHALEQGRVDSLSFDLAVFTNLTRDHLDFHKTIENYAAAKAKLFKTLLSRSPKKNKRAIINLDDSYNGIMRPLDVPVWTYGINEGDFHTSKLKFNFEGTEVEFHTPLGKFSSNLKLVGSHNVSNALAAVAVGTHLGVSNYDIANALSQLQGVKGRLERVITKSKLRVFVDYAHTDDGLRNVLQFLTTVRDTTSPQSKIITVFGCGGDRDQGKRPLMMKAALDKSDFVIVTSDNPRTEDPHKIIFQITEGLSKAQSLKFIVDADRKGAIQLAIRKAGPGDVILIAGKGHEDYQIVGETKHHFDDVEVVKEILNNEHMVNLGSR
jgi:UDP-N-acetylmuramoyl-L-alanyl-D-glutamate--2,6-diaminopimelate ligase